MIVFLTFITESPSGVGYIRTCDPKTCRYGGTCDYDEHGTPRCSCSFSCPSEDGENEKVCGSDGEYSEILPRKISRLTIKCLID